MGRGQRWTRRVHALAMGTGAVAPLLFSQLHGTAWWKAVGVFAVVWLAIVVPLAVWARHRDLRAGERPRAPLQHGR